MAKVLVERPRFRGGYVRGPRKGYRKQLRQALASEDGGIIREGIKVRGGRHKFFNEHLGPLRRYLDSQVGRPWSKVLSEICHHIDRGNVVQKHILSHLFEYVETEPVLIDGVALYPPHRRWWQSRVIHGRFTWYVCPRSGLLRRAPQRSLESRKSRPVTRHWISSRQFCERRAGNGWLLVTVQPIDEEIPGCDDAYLGRFVHKHQTELLVSTYGKTVHAISPRPLTKAEARMLPIPIDLLRPIVQNLV